MDKKKRTREENSSFSMAEFVTPELVPMIYSFFDPLKKDGNRTLRWLLDNDQCISTYPDVAAQFCSKTLFSRKRGEPYDRMVNALEAAEKWRRLDFDDGKRVYTALSRVGKRGYDVIFSRLADRALEEYEKEAFDNLHKTFRKCANANEDEMPNKKEMCSSIATRFLVGVMAIDDKHTEEIPVALVHAAQADYHELFRDAKFRHLFLSDNEIVTRFMLWQVGENTSSKLEVMGAIISGWDLETVLRMAWTFLTKKNYCGPILNFIDAMVLEKVNIDDSMLLLIGSGNKAYTVFKGMDERGLLQGKEHPLEWLSDSGEDCAFQCYNHEWKSGVSVPEKFDIDGTINPLVESAIQSFTISVWLHQHKSSRGKIQKHATRILELASLSQHRFNSISKYMEFRNVI